MINKMDKSWRCCVFSLVTVLASCCSVAEILPKSVCVGNSVQLFQNITSPTLKTNVSLYKEGVGRKVPIAVWLTNASGNFAIIRGIYKSKVFWENGTITLRNIQSSDEAIYSIVYDTAGQSEITEFNKAQIWALAPPDKPCKPKLRQEDNVLIALLDDLAYCGKPAVSVHWMDYPGNSNNSKAVLELKPGKDACTYYACIEGEALECTRKSTAREYCEYITVRSIREDNIPIPSSDSQPSTQTILMIVITVLLVLGIVIVLRMYLWKHSGIVPKFPGRVCSDAERRDQEPSQEQTLTEHQEGIEMEENTDNAQT